jgi:hypothetical protein
MVYWIHIARSIDRVTLHKEKCAEVPSHAIGTDLWNRQGPPTKRIVRSVNRERK